MAEAKKTAFPSDEDFEGWDEEREKEAVDAARVAFGVKYVIGDMTFFAKAPSGNVYRIPLDITLDDSLKLASSDEDAMMALKSLVGEDSDMAESIEKEPVITITDIFEKYGKAIRRIQGVGLGE